MSLRVKVELVLFVVVGLVVGLGYGIQKAIVLPRFLSLEETDAAKDMLRCRDAIDERVAALDTLCLEWSVRPEIRELPQSSDDATPRGVVPPGLDFTAQGLSLAYVIGPDGRVVAGKTIDPVTGQRATIPELPETPWPADHPLLGHTDPAIPLSGLYPTRVGPVLVASRPIPDHNSPTIDRGRLILGRILDERLLRTMVRKTYVGFRVGAIDDAWLSDEDRKAFQRLANTGLLHEVRAFRDMFSVYATYPDIHGRPRFLLRADMDRGLLSRAEHAMREGLLAQVGLGLTALVVLIVLFRHGVMNALSRLTDHTIAIGKTNDLSARLRLERNDEIGTLANEFDRTVARLEEDIQERERAEAALRESEERYALAVEGAHDGIWDWNLQTNTIYFSPRWKSMLGHEDHEIRYQLEDWLSRVHPEDRPLVMACIDAHLKGKSEHLETEYRIRHKDQTYLWVLCRGLGVRDATGTPTRLAGSQSDITPRKRAEEQLTHQAFHDALTALPNRALLVDRLGQALRHARRHQDYRFAVLFLDLDRFKVINEGLGHAVGDQLLQTIAETLASSLRAADTIARNDGTVARFGGDEFVVLLDDIKDVSDATRVAERIQELLKGPFQIDRHEVFTSVSIGVAVGTSAHESADEILRNADTAMYRAKARGKACCEVFDHAMHSKALARLELETDLRRAVAREEFVAYYQPIVALRTGKIEAVETLVRWRHPSRGTVPPIEFIPIAEETGMIVPIGRAVLRAAAQDVRVWQQTLPHGRDLRVSVNLSVREFAQPNLVESIQRTLHETGLDPRHLKLEITESAIMEQEAAVFTTLTRLRKLGIALVIDDFGTGYSSLSYLHRFPMNTLKIDRSFIRDMLGATENMQIVTTILALARNLEMDVIAEGIENREQLDRLRELDCDYGQGYLFSPPIDAQTTTALLVENPSW